MKYSILKKLLFLFLTVGWIIGILASCVKNDEPTILVSSVDATAGDTIEVVVSIKNNPGIAGAKLAIAYDSQLTLIHAEAGDALNTIDYTAPAFLYSGCAFNWDSLTGEASKDGVVLLLTFSITDNVSVGDVLAVSCSYVNGDVYAEDLSDISLDCINGTVTIK